MTPDELRDVRERIGWTQPRAAQQLGVSLRQYKYYEAGESSTRGAIDEIPSPIALAMLCFEFAANIRDLTAELIDEAP